jgi:hypothetical protein
MNDSRSPIFTFSNEFSTVMQMCTYPVLERNEDRAHRSQAGVNHDTK